jgi:hypothetical protein
VRRFGSPPQEQEGLMNRRLIVIVILVIAGLGVVGFITPGYVRYERKTMQLGMFGTQTIRTDRFTGKQQIYGGGKWQPIEINGGKMKIPAGTEIMVN